MNVAPDNEPARQPPTTPGVDSEDTPSLPSNEHAEDDNPLNAAWRWSATLETLRAGGRPVWHRALLERGPLDLTQAVDLWKCPLLVPSRLEAGLTAAICHSEMEKARRFRLEPHRRRSAVARGWLRLVLASCLGVTPAEIQFEQNTHGKPFLKTESSPTALNFSLAHSHDLLLLGVTRGLEIGVDIEQVTGCHQAPAIVRRHFALEEREAWENAPEDARPLLFFELWTLKEAVFKAMGTGLLLPLDTFAVAAGNRSGPPARLLRMNDSPVNPADWTIATFPVEPNYTGAVAVAPPREENHA